MQQLDCPSSAFSWVKSQKQQKNVSAILVLLSLTQESHTSQWCQIPWFNCQELLNNYSIKEQPMIVKIYKSPLSLSDFRSSGRPTLKYYLTRWEFSWWTRWNYPSLCFLSFGSNAMELFLLNLSGSFWSGHDFWPNNYHHMDASQTALIWICSAKQVKRGQLLDGTWLLSKWSNLAVTLLDELCQQSKLSSPMEWP